MKISEAGKKLIEGFEALRLEAYLDSVGIPTIGYGHTEGVKMGTTITVEQADMLMEADLLPVERTVNALIPANCTQNQYDALCSFAFNCGTGALKTMLAHGWDQVPDQILRWDKAGGKPLLGLTRRRQAERAMFVS